MPVTPWRTLRLIASGDGTIDVPQHSSDALGLSRGGVLPFEEVLPEFLGQETELAALRAGGTGAMEIQCAERSSSEHGRKFFDIRVAAGPALGELEIELIDISQHAINLECRSQAYLDLMRNQARLEQQVQDLRSEGEVWANAALVDALTTLPNRRAAEERIGIEVERAQNGWAGCLLFIDLDHFKAFNDSNGHPAGDRRLVLLGSALRMSLRPHDFVARWGGEEFVVLLPRVQQSRAMEIARRLRRRVSLVLGRDSQELGFDRMVGSSISVGMCSLEPGTTAAQALHRADKALYVAKDRGRNRIEVALP